MINLYEAGKIKLNEPVLGPATNEIDRFFYKLSYKYPGYAIKIKNIKVDDILRKYTGFERFALYQHSKSYSEFSANIVIPYSPVGD